MKPAKPQVVAAVGYADRGDKPGRKRTVAVGRAELVTEEAMTAQRLGQRAQEHQRRGRAEANARKRADTAAKHAEWQALADAARRKHPRWSRWRIASEIASRCGATVGTVHKAIK